MLVISIVLFVSVLTLIPVGQWAVRKEIKLRPAKMGIATIRFTEADVVRHPLVTRMVRAYEGQDRKRAAGPDGAPST